MSSDRLARLARLTAAVLLGCTAILGVSATAYSSHALISKSFGGNTSTSSSTDSLLSNSAQDDDSSDYVVATPSYYTAPGVTMSADDTYKCTGKTTHIGYNGQAVFDDGFIAFTDDLLGTDVTNRLAQSHVDVNFDIDPVTVAVHNIKSIIVTIGDAGYPGLPETHALVDLTDSFWGQAFANNTDTLRLYTSDFTVYTDGGDVYSLDVCSDK